MRPTKPLKPSRSPARLATRWTTRLAAAAVLAPVGLTLTATQAPAPVAAHLPQAVPASGPVVSGSWSRDDGVVAALKQASVSAPGESSSVLEVSPGVDLPAPALRAYQFAEAVMRRADPACRLDWSLLAAIGDVESDHGRYGGAQVRPDGASTPHILGPRLDGGGEVAAIADTDQGGLDGDGRWDRAVGPMQFIPSTWALVGADADGDGGRDPHDIDDAALAAAAYLCAGDGDLSTPAGQEEAVYRYNHSDSYVDLVLQLAAAYADDGFALTAPQPAVRSASKPVDLPALSAPVEVGAHPAQSPARSLGVQESRRDAAARDRQRSGAEARASQRSSGSDAGSSTSSRSGGQTSGGTRDGGGDTGAGGSGGDQKSTSGSTSPSGDSDGGGSGGTDPGPIDGSGTDGSDSGGTAGGGGTTGGSAGSGDGTTGGGSTGGGTTDGGSTDGGGAEEESSNTPSGTLGRSDDGTWFVGETAVSFGDDAYLAGKALNDFDGADGVESNLGELETLVGTSVSVVLEGDLVQEVDGMAYR
jgi:hypothetical protein